MDTRTGLILGTVSGEAKYEEVAIPSAVETAGRRTTERAHNEAAAKFQADFQRVMITLAKTTASEGGTAGEGR